MLHYETVSSELLDQYFLQAESEKQNSIKQRDERLRLLIEQREKSE